MSWFTSVLDELSDALQSTIQRRLNAYFYEDEDKHEYGPEDEYDPEADLESRPSDFRGDIPLHFNAPPGEYGEQKKKNC